jgi:hypothetical protein
MSNKFSWPQSSETYIKGLLTKFRNGREVCQNPSRSEDFYAACRILKEEGYTIYSTGQRYIAKKSCADSALPVDGANRG